MTIALIGGARPNFIKAAPLYRALKAQTDAQIYFLHTGQHRDSEMSEVFFRELGLPEPWITLQGNKRSAAGETARILAGLEPCLNKLKPDWVIVIGDITTTLAGALAAKQAGSRLAHVEAGLRSHDRSMPEELNRVVVDHLADALFVSEAAGVENLQREGIPPERIFFTGNILIDALMAILPQANARSAADLLREMNDAVHLPAFRNGFALFTFHRPENVDERPGLERIVSLIEQTATLLPVIFPVHPRTTSHLKRFGLTERLESHPNLLITAPLPYSGMVSLMKQARVVLTDSGGVQEETTWLGTPCLTFRSTTERPATLQYGTNTLISDRSPAKAVALVKAILKSQYKTGSLPPLWDGHAAGRMVEILLKLNRGV